MSYENRKDVQKWIELAEGNYTPEELKEDFSGVGDLNKVMNVLKVALKSKGNVNVKLKKMNDGSIDYKIDA